MLAMRWVGIMLPMDGRACVVALIFIVSIATHLVFTDGLGRMGINYGTLGDNLAAPNATIGLLQRCVFRDVRIYDTNEDVLQAFILAFPPQGPFGVIVGTHNDDLLPLSLHQEFADSWVAARIFPFSTIPIRGIVVGNEAIPGPLAQYVPGAMFHLRLALDSWDLRGIYVTTTLFGRTIANSFPPSAAVFSQDSMFVMQQIVSSMKVVAEESRGPIFVHIYPYFAYASNHAEIPLDYALFRASAQPVQDGNLTYTNLFDAMFDSYMWAMEKIGGGGIEIAVGETGWPSGGNEVFTTPELAAEYNRNLYTHITTLGGSPRGWQTQKLWPKLALVFSLFNEDLKPPGAERYWGLRNPDLTPAYATPMCP